MLGHDVGGSVGQVGSYKERENSVARLVACIFALIIGREESGELLLCSDHESGLVQGRVSNLHLSP